MTLQTAIERKPWPTLKRHTYDHIALRVGKKGHVLLRLEPSPQCSKNQQQSSNIRTKTTRMPSNNGNTEEVNVRTLNRIGQLPELIASAVQHKLDGICIQEQLHTCTPKISNITKQAHGWTQATVAGSIYSVNATEGGVRNVYRT